MCCSYMIRMEQAECVYFGLQRGSASVSHTVTVSNDFIEKYRSCLGLNQEDIGSLPGLY